MGLDYERKQKEVKIKLNRLKKTSHLNLKENRLKTASKLRTYRRKVKEICRKDKKRKVDVKDEIRWEKATTA